jgi:hypothetical protein
MDEAAKQLTFLSPQFALGVLVIVLTGWISFVVFRFIAAPSDEAIYDPARTLTNSLLGMIWVLLVFTGAIIVAQILDHGNANTESWAAFTGLMGWVTGVNSTIINNRFGSTKASAEKDETIKQLAVGSGTGTGSGSGSATPPAIVAEQANVTAQTATVTETKP